MSLPDWLRPFSLFLKPRNPRPVRRYVRLALEALEDRLTPSTALAPSGTAGGAGGHVGFVQPAAAAAPVNFDFTGTPATVDLSTQTSLPVTVTLTSAGSPVYYGSVQFSLINPGGTVIESSPQETPDSFGVASSTLPVPFGTPPGNYTVQATYTPYYGTPSSGSTLVVFDNAPTTVGNVTAAPSPVFACMANTETLSAPVSSAYGTPTGSIAFVLTAPNGTTFTTTAPVGANGVATSTVVVGPNAPVGTYGLTAAFTDPTGAFAPSSRANPAALTVQPATTSVAVSNVTAAYSPAPQPVLLTATLSSNCPPVTTGQVLFTVFSPTGAPVGTAGPAPVTNGTASATFTAPAGLAAGTYPIQAAYTDASGQNLGSTGTGTLTITRAATVLGNIAIGPTPVFNDVSNTETATATVTTTNGTPVGTGAVTFTLTGPSGPSIMATAIVGANGVATTTLTIPVGAAPGSYTLSIAYADSGGNFGPASATLANAVTVLAQATSITGSSTPPTLVQSASPQSLTVNATVVNDGAPVVGGTVAFALLTSTGIPVAGATATGTTNAAGQTPNVTLPVPANTPAGSYMVRATWTDPNGVPHTAAIGALTILSNNNPVTTTVPTIPPIIVIPGSGQPLPVSATFTSPAGTVNEGQATFTLFRAGTEIPVATMTVPVVNGTAATTLTVPASAGPGSYTLQVSYTDSPALGFSGRFANSSGSTPVAIEAGPTSVSVTNLSVPFPHTDPTIKLTATVLSGEVPVNEGQVTFSIAGVPGTSASATVANGLATVFVTLPANTAVGSYTITAAYNDNGGSLQNSTGTGTLTITPLPSTVTINNTNIVYDLFGERETLSAVVRDPLGIVVNEGVVTFTEAGQTLSAPIVNGLATVTFNIPLMAENPFAHAVALAFGDPNGNFLPSTGLFTLEQTLFDFLLQMMAVSDLMQQGNGGSS